MEKQLHEYPIGKPIDAENTPRLGQTYWRIAGERSNLNVIPQLWGYSPKNDSIAVKLRLAYRTKEDALYACRGGQLQEITE